MERWTSSTSVDKLKSSTCGWGEISSNKKSVHIMWSKVENCTTGHLVFMMGVWIITHCVVYNSALVLIYNIPAMILLILPSPFHMYPPFHMVSSHFYISLCISFGIYHLLLPSPTPGYWIFTNTTLWYLYNSTSRTPFNPYMIKLPLAKLNMSIKLLIFVV